MGDIRDLAVGEAFPVLQLIDGEGQATAVAAGVDGRPLLLFVLRAFG